MDAVLHKEVRVGLPDGIPVHQAHIVKVLGDPGDHLVVGTCPAPCAVHIDHHHGLAIGQLLQQHPKLPFGQIAVGAQMDHGGIAQLFLFAQALHKLDALTALPPHFGFDRCKRQSALQVRACT